MTEPLVIELPTRKATLELGRRLAPLLCARDLVVLSGALGAGKTFLVRAVCRALGLSAEERVTSPTFSLVHEYETQPPVAHADLYRLSEPHDVQGLGLDSMRDDGRVLLVEWGEPFVALLGGDALLVALSREPRRAVIDASGPRSTEILAKLRT
jgi:tRNA threonylcarbamoyladenosine biosynthesis protein TsaE